jgi:hypothetical protein
MTPLGLVVTGGAFVLLDFRVDGLDLAADVLGWLLAAFGAWALRPRSDWFLGATGAAAVGVAIGVPNFWAEPAGVFLVVTSVVETAFVFAVLSGVVQAARAHEPTVADRANLLRWLDLGLLVVATVLLPVVPEPALVLVVGLATLGVAAWILIFWLSVRGRAYLQPPVGVPGAATS